MTNTLGINQSSITQIAAQQQTPAPGHLWGRAAGYMDYRRCDRCGTVLKANDSNRFERCYAKPL